MSKNDIEVIKNSISRYLSMREHSKLELEEKLLKKYFEKDLILQCINEFSEKDLQSDYRYAESFIRTKFNDHKGEIFIRSSLKNKGVRADVIDKILLEYDDDDWLAQAISALEKKTFKNNITELDKKKKQNIFLNNRGFTFKIIDTAINEYWKQ
tara:strand:- start:112 stop:573 length:462 start_codon:yes stop_codon:yes gene_type:complete